MHTTLLVFSYPREAQYDQIPAEYDGGEIEDYSVQCSEFEPKVGQGIPAKYHYWDDDQWRVGDREWRVAKIHRYQAVGDKKPKFSIAIATFDGKPVDMAFEEGDNSILQILLKPDGYNLSWPQHPDYAKDVGDAFYDEPYEVAQVARFEPCNGEPMHIYNDVRVGWCVPVTASEPAVAVA